jgi:glycosyltransferase involved in cell wall biosynthesis
MLTLSIIIPVFNLEKHINISLKSLINQVNQNFEIIIVNDGSSDNTIKVVQDIMSNSGFINYKIIDQKNSGVSSARNNGLSEAKGKYIYFLDGDDYVSSDFVEIINKRIEIEFPDVIAWGFDIVKEDKTTINKYFKNYSQIDTELRMTGIEVLENILCENRRIWIWTCSAIYKKELILNNNLAYTNGCINGEDQEFTFKALSEASQVIFLNEVLSYYVQRENSTSNSYNIRKFDVIDAIRRVVEHISNKNIENSENIIQYLNTNHLFGNFFHVINSHIKSLQFDKKIGAIGSWRLLENDIEESFPGLLFQIKSKINDKKIIYFIASLKTRLKYRVFGISPILYIFMSRILFRVIGIG